MKANTFWLKLSNRTLLTQILFIGVFTTMSLSKLTNTCPKAPDQALFSGGLLVALSHYTLSSKLSQVLEPQYLQV